MFTDDTILFASNKRASMQMIRGMRDALADYGLDSDMDKCEIQTSQAGVCVRAILIDGQSIPMVNVREGLNVFGTHYTLCGRQSAEVKTPHKSRMGAI